MRSFTAPQQTQPLLRSKPWQRALRVASLLTAGLGGVCITSALPPVDAQTNTPTAPVGTNILEQMESALTGIVRETRSAVVSIEGRIPSSLSTPAPYVTTSSTLSPSAPGSAKFFSVQSAAVGATWRLAQEEALRLAMKAQKRQVQKEKAAMQGTLPAPGTSVTGSGFLIPDGFVVTTAEVTEGLTAENTTIVLADGQRCKPDWIHADRRSNVAVLKVQGLATNMGLHWGDSSRIGPGNFALTIGNQAGFPNSVALGLVSGTGRTGRSGLLHYHNLIQFQGVVGGGSSGSPLLNARGEVVGMIVATPAPPDNRLPVSPSESGGTRSGAPISAERPLGTSPHLGSNPDRTPRGEREVKIGRTASAVLSDARLRQNSAEPNETGYGVKSLSNPPLSSQEAGKSRSFRALRGNPSPANTRVEAPNNSTSVLPFGGISNTGFALPAADIHALVERLSQPIWPAAHTGWVGVRLDTPTGGEAGALVTGVIVGSPADRAGLQPGDVVIAANGQSIRTANDMRLLAWRVNANEAVRLEIRRAGISQMILLTTETKPDDDTLRHMPIRMLLLQMSSTSSKVSAFI